VIQYFACSYPEKITNIFIVFSC